MIDLLPAPIRDYGLKSAARRLRAAVERSAVDEPVDLVDEFIGKLDGDLKRHTKAYRSVMREDSRSTRDVR